MKSKYCFILNPGRFTVDTVVFHVWVGRDFQSQAKLTLLQEYAKDCGMYLNRWSSKVDEALFLAASSLRPHSLLPTFYLRRIDIDVRELYRRIIDNTLDEFLRVDEAKRKRHNLLAMLDPSVFFERQTHPKKASLQAVPRKNLKPSQQDDFISFLVGFGLILILFLLDAIVSNVWLYV